ncbi:MAG: DUF2398 family protein [Victivallales bacterium]
MENNFNELKVKYPDQAKAVLNILLESPYFYRSDNDNLFLFLRRHQQEFKNFFSENFGWELIMDGKCARVHKETWFNEAITPTSRLQFHLGRRDECIAFMLLLEFYEKLLDENSMTAEDAANPHFKFGDLLEHQQRRFTELFEKECGKYTAEHIRKNILSPLMSRLIRYRLVREIPRPHGLEITWDEYIYEALPALYHYNAGRLGNPVGINAYETAAQDDLPPDEGEEDGDGKE